MTYHELRKAGTNLSATLRRLIGWKGIGLVISLSIAALAFVALADAIKTIDGDRVLAAIWATDHARIALAAVLVAASYGSLTLYDLLALREIGHHHIRYPVAALAGATSYPIAHGVGAVLPVSSAIRYRIYSNHGLGAVDVAKICFLTGLTFWLGNLTALALSVCYQPDSLGLIDRAPASINRLLALAMLLAIAGYLWWTWREPRRVGHQKWSVNLPAGRSALLQIGIGVFDLGCAALALYVLIPPEAQIPAARVIAVFIAATLLGFISHSPAGLGVFDATILVGLGVADENQLVAALLLFRLLYHFSPFVLALAVFIFREGRKMLTNHARLKRHV